MNLPRPLPHPVPMPDLPGVGTQAASLRVFDWQAGSLRSDILVKLVLCLFAKKPGPLGIPASMNSVELDV